MVIFGYIFLLYYLFGLYILSSAFNQYKDEYINPAPIGKIQIKDIPIIIRMIIIIFGGLVWLPLFIYAVIVLIKTGRVKQIAEEINEEIKKEDK